MSPGHEGQGRRGGGEPHREGSSNSDREPPWWHSGSSFPVPASLKLQPCALGAPADLLPQPLRRAADAAPLLGFFPCLQIPQQFLFLFPTRGVLPNYCGQLCFPVLMLPAPIPGVSDSKRTFKVRGVAQWLQERLWAPSYTWKINKQKQKDLRSLFVQMLSFYRAGNRAWGVASSPCACWFLEGCPVFPKEILHIFLFCGLKDGSLVLCYHIYYFWFCFVSA